MEKFQVAVVVKGFNTESDAKAFIRYMQERPKAFVDFMRHTQGLEVTGSVSKQDATPDPVPPQASPTNASP